ncbi:MAG: peptidylprolyl isomerase [Euryarchaeota archaeon]|nr:peptidylprolyl isomerase [Euryarchaeota archaeon]
MNKQLIIFIVMASILVSSGCINSDSVGSAAVVKEGDQVSVDYTGRLENGTVFDTSVEDVAVENGAYNPNRDYKPIEFTVGAGQMIKGFDSGVVGMAVGEEKTLTLSPEDAYGTHSEEMVQTVPVDELSAAGITPVLGEKLTTSMGQVGTITDVTNTSVVVDFNHRLAGKILIFDVKLVSISGEDIVAGAGGADSNKGGNVADATENTREENRIANIETSMGTMTVELYEERAPDTTSNFIELANRGFYNNLIFHRVIDNFMVQGGDPKGDGTGGSGKTIKLEINPELTHVDGAVAMARSAHPDSASSQFYICDGAQHQLDGQYTVFGRVTNGMDIVRAIAEVETDSGNRPLENVTITRITIQES